MTHRYAIDLIDAAIRRSSPPCGVDGESTTDSGHFAIEPLPLPASEEPATDRPSAPAPRGTHRVRMTWVRDHDVLVCVAVGDAFVTDEEFEPFIEHLASNETTRVLLGAYGSPAFNSEQRTRVNRILGATSTVVAMVFDGSLITRGMGVALSRSIPRLRGFAVDELLAALDHLALEGEARRSVAAAFEALSFFARALEV